MGTKKWMAFVICIAVAMVMLTGCGKSKKPDAEISIFIWTEYLPQEVLDKFQEKYNVKVNLATYSSSGDAYAKVKSAPPGTYDVIDTSEFYLKYLVNEGFLEKLNFDNIPNYKYVMAGYRDPWYDPGNVYSVPYMGVTAALCINTSLVKEPVTSYADLFRPEFLNSLVLIDDFRVIIGAINVMLGFDYNETDPVKLAQTEAKLMELKPNVKMLDSDSPKSAMISGDTSAGLIYAAEIAIAMEENPDIQIIFPIEGQYLSEDDLTVASGSKNKKWAETLINFILEPEISKIISEAFPYSNPNSEAIKLLGPDFANNPAKNIPESALAKGLALMELDDASLELYNDIWTNFTR